MNNILLKTGVASAGVSVTTVLMCVAANNQPVLLVDLILLLIVQSTSPAHSMKSLSSLLM